MGDGIQQRWRWTTMTTRSMAMVRRATMMAMLVNKIVKLIILLICLQYNVYRQRLLPPGERTPRGSRAGAMQENFQGGGENSSPACCSCRVLLTPWFSPLSCRHNWLSCEGLRVHQGTEDEFWWGIEQNQPTKFPTTAFSDKSHLNSKNVKTKINKMTGWIENGP